MGNVVLKQEMACCGPLILVTPEYPLRVRPGREQMQALLRETPEILLAKEAKEALCALLAETGGEAEITGVSGFRTREEQEKIWEDSIRENGPAFTKKFVALPGHSEHETGLAIDLAKRQPGIDFICPEFPRDGSFGVFRDKLPRYGFIERYLEGKENITGIGAEPWHFRYVGFPHSAIIAERGMVLEEYIEFLKEGASLRKPYRYGGIAVFYVPLCGETEKAVCLPDAPCSVSGTNEGGFVITVWEDIA